MKRKKRILLITSNFRMHILAVLFVLSAVFVKGQDNQQIDSLYNVLKTTEIDTNKVLVLMQLGDAYEFSAPDTTLYFYNMALSVATKSGNQKYIANCNRYIGLFYSSQGEYDKSISYFMTALKINETIKERNGIASCCDNLGIAYFYKGDYNKAINLFLKSLKIREEIGDKRGISKSYNSIGNVHYYMNDFNKALDYYTKAMIIIEQLGDKNGISSCYNNIGLVYMDQGKSFSDIKKAKDNYLKAIDFFTKSMKIDVELQDKKGISTCYSNLGFAWFRMEDYDKTISFYLKSLKIDEEIGDKDGMAQVLNNLADLKIKLKDYNAAIDYAQKSLKIGLETGGLPLQQTANEKLAAAYEGLGNFKKAYEFYRNFKLINDSIFNLEGSKQIKQMEAHYQSERKQLEIDNLTKDKVLKENELNLSKKDLQRQRIILYSFIMGFLTIALFSIMLFKQYKAKNKAYVLLEQKNIKIETMNAEISAQRDDLQLFNAELQQKNEEIMAQRDEIESHLDRIQKQKLVIEQKNNSITASISYAQRIQQSVLPDASQLRMLFPESFVLFKPKDIVSGDFYWLGEKAGKIFVAVVDCTGHGVPGAFMSLLGYVFLNQALHGTQAESPAEILNFLNNELFVTLRKSTNDSYIKDGMDLSVCSINKNTLILEYAGVHNDSFLFRNNEIFELKSDNYQIGEPFSEKFPSFTNKSIKLKKNDVIYLFSDGYIDQFGGIDNRKFLSKQFKETLLKISGNSLKDQGFLLDEIMERWKNDFETKHKQTDDITVIGMKI